jgi:hypothetical protein
MNLFGNGIIGKREIPLAQRRKVFRDYESFVEKFKPKKTTDDCYTPRYVYDYILKYVAGKADISGCETVRPFYPGGDYKNFAYPDNCVVIDNPPFSIITPIVRFYLEKNIKFFLFAPHMTLFQASWYGCTALIVGAGIIYENGAKVKTSFLSNLFGDIAVTGEAGLYKDLEELVENEQKQGKKKQLPKYIYPGNVLTVSMVHSLVLSGISIQFDRSSVCKYKALECQKAADKSIFGGGYLISDKAAAEKTAAEKTAAEKTAAIRWELSEKELDIIKSLK